MPRNLPRVLLAAKTKKGRQRQRRGLRLRDFTVTQKTKARYESAVSKILPFLESQDDTSDLDGLVCDFMELQWSRDEAVGYIADVLSGLHFFMPELRGTLRHSWRLFRQWRRVEAPQRAPPLTVWIVKAVIARALEIDQLAFAALFAVGYHCLLRTGELLALQFKDLELSSETGVISLYSSKSGLRTGTEEAVAVRDPLVLDLPRTLAVSQRFCPGQKLWPYSAQFFRNRFAEHMRFFRISHLQMKPYSLRRGGATFLLQIGLPLDTILLRGRWRSLNVARLYLQDGLPQLPHLRIDPVDRKKLERYSSQCPHTAFQPRPC